MRIGAFALLALSAAFVSSAKAVPKPDSMAMDVHVTSEELQGNAVPMRLVERWDFEFDLTEKRAEEKR